MISIRYEQMYQNEKLHWWYLGRRILLVNLLRKLELPRHPAILDIGCGTGYTLSVLSRFGIVSGVDKTGSAVAFCRKRGFSRIKKTDGKTLPYNKNTFDLVTCLDVLEHIKKEGDALKEIKRVLKPKGIIIIFVPAFSLLWSELDSRSKHYRRYEFSLFKKLLESNGFSVRLISYFNYLFFIPIFIVRLWQKTSFGKRNYWGLDPVIHNYTLNKLLTFFFKFDVWSAPKLHPPFGVSLYAVCMKK